MSYQLIVRRRAVRMFELLAENWQHAVGALVEDVHHVPPVVD